MSRHVVVHVLAELELNDAAQYYERECEGLGAAFLAEVRRSFDSILAHPDAGTPVRGKLRRRLVARFPYGLLYTVTPQQIRILAVMNLRRRPCYWVGRR